MLLFFYIITNLKSKISSNDAFEYESKIRIEKNFIADLHHIRTKFYLYIKNYCFAQIYNNYEKMINLYSEIDDHTMLYETLDFFKISSESKDTIIKKTLEMSEYIIFVYLNGDQPRLKKFFSDNDENFVICVFNNVDYYIEELMMEIIQDINKENITLYESISKTFNDIDVDFSIILLTSSFFCDKTEICSYLISKCNSSIIDPFSVNFPEDKILDDFAQVNVSFSFHCLYDLEEELYASEIVEDLDFLKIESDVIYQIKKINNDKYLLLSQKFTFLKKNLCSLVDISEDFINTFENKPEIKNSRETINNYIEDLLIIINSIKNIEHEISVRMDVTNEFHAINEFYKNLNLDFINLGYKIELLKTKYQLLDQENLTNFTKFTMDNDIITMRSKNFHIMLKQEIVYTENILEINEIVIQICDAFEFFITKRAASLLASIG